MEITRGGSRPSGQGSGDYFTGRVRQDPIVEAPAPARVRAVLVTFEPGARTAWHTHPLGQTLFVTSGLGRAQVWGGEIRELSLWAAGGALPDVTVLLDVDPDVARKRLDAADKPFDRLEAEQGAFHERVRRAFLDLADAEPDRFLVVDATQPVEVIAAAIRERVSARLS